MITKEKAIEVRDHVLRGIENLMKAANVIGLEPNDPSDKELLKALGIAVGDIDIEVLSRIYKIYPEIDDLKIKGIL